jgi:hypothetical protein
MGQKLHHILARSRQLNMRRGSQLAQTSKSEILDSGEGFPQIPRITTKANMPATTIWGTIG